MEGEIGTEKIKERWPINKDLPHLSCHSSYSTYSYLIIEALVRL
jgi:hypothetical protein